MKGKVAGFVVVSLCSSLVLDIVSLDSLTHLIYTSRMLANLLGPNTRITDYL